MEADYGKVGMQKIITTVGNVVSGSARSKETLEWLSSDIFGKVVSAEERRDHRHETRPSINLNENMDSLVPASRNLGICQLDGYAVRRQGTLWQPRPDMNGSMNIQESRRVPRPVSSSARPISTWLTSRKRKRVYATAQVLHLQEP